MHTYITSIIVSISELLEFLRKLRNTVRRKIV